MQAKPILDESLAKHGGSSTYPDRLPFNGEIRTTVVSVIVPVWNSATHLQACIDSLLRQPLRSEEHTSELQSLMRISYAVFCLQKHKSHQYVSPSSNLLHVSQSLQHRH